MGKRTDSRVQPVVEARALATHSIFDTLTVKNISHAELEKQLSPSLGLGHSADSRVKHQTPQPQEGARFRQNLKTTIEVILKHMDPVAKSH